MGFVLPEDVEERSYLLNLYEIKEEIWGEDYCLSKFYKRDTGKIVMYLVSFGPEYELSNEGLSDYRRDDYDEDAFLFFYDPNNLYCILEEDLNAVFTNLDSQTTRDTIIHSLSNLEIKDLKNLFGENGLFVENNSKKIGIRSFYDSSSDYITTKMREEPVSSKANLLTVFMSNDKKNIDKIEPEWELINSFCLMGEFITSFSSDNKLDGLCFTLMSKIE